MKCCELGTKEFFLFGARLFFGAWLLYVGLWKVLAIGPEGFVGYITSDFDKTWSPHILNVVLAWVILVAEPVLALWILSGRHARQAWTFTAALMFLLTFGQTMLMKFEGVANNWQYLVLCLACAAMSEPGACPVSKGK